MDTLNRPAGLPFNVPGSENPSSIQPSPNDPPWNSWTAFFVWALSVVLIIVIPGLFLLPYIALYGASLTDNQAVATFLTTDPTAIMLQLAAILPAHLLTLLAAWLVVTRLRTYRFRETLGWQTGGIRWWHYVAILAGFLAFAGLVGAYFPEQENDLLRILRSSRTAVVLIALLATFTAPLVEEVIYRGILYSAFQRTFGVAIAIVVVTVLFALVHVPQYYPSYSTIFLLTLLSLILTLVRVWTNNLLGCIILHTIFNGFQSLMLILEPYFPSSGSEPAASAAVISRILT